MKSQLQPLHLLLVILAGWINRRQQDAIEYLLTENRVLREKLGKKRILLSDDQRRRLAVKGKILGRKVLEQVARAIVDVLRFAAFRSVTFSLLWPAAQASSDRGSCL